MIQLERTKDEIVLDWIALRQQGYTTGQIGRLYDVTPSQVRTSTNRVRNEDAAHDPSAAGVYTW